MVDHRLDHLVYATPNVEETVEDLFQALGVRALVGGQHIGWGTHNCVASLGNGVYLEIVGPDPRQPEPDEPRPFLIDHITSPCLVTWAVSVPDMAAALAVSKKAGYDPGPARAMSRATPDGGTLAWELTSPPFGDDGGLVPFILAWGSTVHPSTTSVKGLSLVSFAATHPQPEQVSRMLHALGTSLPIEPGPKPWLEARLRGPAGEAVLHS
jgi:Glyoxalase-like domain